MRNTYCLYCSYDVLYRVPGWSVYLISRSARSGFVCVSMIFGQNTLISAPIMVSLTALQRLCRNMRHLHFCLRLYFGSGIQPTVSARCQLIHGHTKIQETKFVFRTPKKKRYIVKPASTIYATFVRISLMLSYLILSH